ncbi:MAG: beta-mannanase [Deltaproteobacteria bacterium]|nr:beta-mannanase [Deltaproteobacteria bacterium]
MEWPSRTFWESDEGVAERGSETAKKMAFVMFANDWVDGPYFPWDGVDGVSQVGKVPYIRILPRSTRAQYTGSDYYYSMDRFLAGYYDNVLRQWARSARATASPLFVEWAPEMNGRWYQWNGLWSGGGYTFGFGNPNLADGPEKYRAVYQRVVTIFNQEGATNVTWVFHVNWENNPREYWNTMAAYYPGDQFVDWLGISVFGAQYAYEYYDSFTNVFDAAYGEFSALSATKPMMVAEFGVVEQPGDPNGKAQWLTNALQSIVEERYPRVKGISYWNESSWTIPQNNNLRIDSSPQAVNAYATGIHNDVFVSDLEVNW